MSKQSTYRERRDRGRRVAHVEIEAKGLPALLAEIGYLAPGDVADRKRVDAALGELIEELRLAKLRSNR